MNRRTLLKTVLRRAGAVLSRRFGKVTYTTKGRANLVTAADFESQALILSALRRAFPQDDYKAEENETKLTDAEHVWLIDPLDGTTNYAHGYPASCVSIGVLRNGHPLLGGVYDPFRRELFLAEKGKGAMLNGRPMKVTQTGKISQSLLVTGFGYDRARRADFYLSHFKAFMIRSHDIRRSGSAALDMAWIAAGRVDGFWEFQLNPWDVAAGWLLVEEAGGRVTDFSGRSWADLNSMGAQTLATNSRLHGDMLRVLARVGSKTGKRV